MVLILLSAGFRELFERFFLGKHKPVFGDPSLGLDGRFRSVDRFGAEGNFDNQLSG